MSGPGYTLTLADLLRVKGAVRYVETISRETTNVTPIAGFGPSQTAETVVWPIKVTGTTPPGGSTLLSHVLVGTVSYPDASSWVTADVLIRPPNDDITLIGNGTQTLGVLIGSCEDAGPYFGWLVFAAVGDVDAGSGSCSGSIAACCGPGAGIFPDSESIPTHPAYHPYQVTDTQCIEGILHVLKERHRDVWNKDICEVVDDYFDPKVTEAGCCDCPSGSASGSTPLVPCIPYSLLCVTYSGGTGVCACINGLTATLTLTAGTIENITWQGTINTTPIALTCTGGVWTMSHLEPETASSCEVEGGAGEAFYPPSLPFTISLTGMTINGTECGTITATISLGACEEASGSTSACGFCDTYVVQEWTELYTGIVHPAETLTRNTTAYPGVACCWQSANYTMFTAHNGFVLYNSQDIQLAPCAWNSPASNPDDTPSWDGNGCATFTGTTIGSCQDVTVCCGDSGSGSGSGSVIPPDCCVVTTETFVEGGADCASATELVPGAYWALTTSGEAWFHFTLTADTAWGVRVDGQPGTDCDANVTSPLYFNNLNDCGGLSLYAIEAYPCVVLLGTGGGGYNNIWLKITAPVADICYKITVFSNTSCTP